MLLSSLYVRNTDLEISNFLNCARSFVHKVRRELEASDGDTQSVAKRKKHEERSDTIRTTQFIQQIQAVVDENPSKSIRALARDLKVSEGLVRRVVHEDLRYKSYVMRRGQFMSAQTREQRTIRGKRLLNKLKHPEAPNMLWFFSDEKNFDQDQKINRRNDRWLCSEPTEVPRVMHTKFPATVMVLGVVSNEGHVMPPHFFSQGLRVNAAAYIEVLESVVKPWIDSVCGNRPYIFQQDSAPSHKAMATQDWMAENFHDHITPNLWPPSSPDLNPLDYYVWGVVERETNKHPHNTISSLKDAITTTMANMNKEHLIRACSRFRPRIEEVIAANGDFIE